MGKICISSCSLSILTCFPVKCRIMGLLLLSVKFMCSGDCSNKNLPIECLVYTFIINSAFILVFHFSPTFTFRNWLRDVYYYSGRHENYWVQILGRIYDMKIWTHFNSGVLKVSFPPASVFVKVRIGEGAPCDFLFSLHIFTPIIYFWSFCWLPSFSIIFIGPR